ncbi:hypothetical protein AAG906_026052 [Vitis piasezkii]
MQKTSSRKPIDRWVLWKLARLKKDELTKAVEEGKITCVGQKDILTLALGTLEHPGRVRGKGGKKKPKQFFNTPKPTKTLEEEECQRMLMEKVKSLEEEIIALKAGKKEPLTPRSEVSSTNIRKQLLQHEEIGGKTHDSAHVENLSAQGTRKASPLTQVYMPFSKFMISINGADILVVILYPLQPNALLPFPLSENIRTIREGVGYEVLSPIAFVINDDDEDVGKRKNKTKKIQASLKKIKYENPRDVQLFSKTVSTMLEGKPHPKLTFNQCFGMKFQTFLLTSEMNDVISAKELTMNCIFSIFGEILWLHEHLDETLQEKIIFIHPGMVSKAGTIAPQIEKRARFHWVLAVIDLKSQIVYYLDSIATTIPRYKRYCEHKKGSKKELKWMVVEGPKQLDGVMCGYFVMRYMRDIIANRSLLTSRVSGDICSCCNFEMTRSYVHRNVIQHKRKCHSSSPLKWCSPWKESSSHQLVLVCQCHNKLRLAPC